MGLALLGELIVKHVGSFRFVRASRGVTLIELMVAIAVLAILASVAVPSFQRLSAEYRVNSQANVTQAAFQFARSEALKRRSDVVICPVGPVMVVFEGNSCNDADAADADNLLVLPIDARVTLAGLPAAGLRFAANGFTVPFAPTNVDISDPGGAVDARRVRVVGSGFSEIIRLGS